MITDIKLSSFPPLRNKMCLSVGNLKGVWWKDLLPGVTHVLGGRTPPPPPPFSAPSGVVSLPWCMMFLTWSSGGRQSPNSALTPHVQDARWHRRRRTGYDSALPQQRRARRSKWVKYIYFSLLFFFSFCPDAFFMPLKTKHKRSDLELVKTRRISLPWCRFWSNFTQATPYQQTLCAWLLSYGQRHSHNLHLFAWPIIACSAPNDDQISGAPWLLAFTYIQPPNKIKKHHRMRERTTATIGAQLHLL